MRTLHCNWFQDVCRSAMCWTNQPAVFIERCSFKPVIDVCEFTACKWNQFCLSFSASPVSSNLILKGKNSLRHKLPAVRKQGSVFKLPFLCLFLYFRPLCFSCCRFFIKIQLDFHFSSSPLSSRLQELDTAQIKMTNNNTEQTAEWQNENTAGDERSKCSWATRLINTELPADNHRLRCLSRKNMLVWRAASSINECGAF